MTDINRKSASLKANSSVRGGKSTDLMGEMTDEFHRLKDEPSKKG
jgi:hypothetical protein